MSVPDLACFEMPGEAGLELSTMICLDDQHAKEQPSNDLVHKTNR
jgi:hypothetical protein